MIAVIFFFVDKKGFVAVEGREEMPRRVPGIIVRNFGPVFAAFFGGRCCMKFYTTWDDDVKNVWLRVIFNRRDYAWFRKNFRPVQIKEGLYFTNSSREMDTVYIYSVDENGELKFTSKGFANEFEFGEIHVNFYVRLNESFVEEHREWFEESLE